MVDKTLRVQYRRGNGANQGFMIVQIYEQISQANKTMIVSVIVEPENPDKENANYGIRKIQVHLGNGQNILEIHPTGWLKSYRDVQASKG